MVQFYKFRGHTIEILNELRYSAGMTPRYIANAILAKVRVTSVVLQRMKRYGVIEKIEGFGWRITAAGIEVLKFLSGISNNNNVNTSHTHDKQKVKPEKEIKPPICYARSYCPIQRYWKDKSYSEKARLSVCETCAQNEPENYTDNIMYQIKARIRGEVARVG